MGKTIRTLEGGRHYSEEIVSEDCKECGYDRMIHTHLHGAGVHALACQNPDCGVCYEA